MQGSLYATFDVDMIAHLLLACAAVKFDALPLSLAVMDRL